MQLQKKLLKTSVILNIGLILLVALINNSNNSAYENQKFIESTRITNINILNKFIVGKTTKDEVLNLLKNEPGYFDKPDKNIISAGTLDFIFDSNNLLSEIKTLSFEGP